MLVYLIWRKDNAYKTIKGKYDVVMGKGEKYPDSMVPLCIGDREVDDTLIFIRKSFSNKTGVIDCCTGKKMGSI
ncbi:MAG: hypothetical protein ACXWWC_08265 [Chitinophagaceae bacterium]